MFIELSLFNLFFCILWIIGIIMLCLLIKFRKKINLFLRRIKKNKVVHFNLEEYYKLEINDKKYYFLKDQINSLKELLKSEDLELVIIEDLRKLVIINKDESLEKIDQIVQKLSQPKILSIKFESDIEMVKPREIIINI
jgi:histidyl-tRNA synthetase